ncbi:MAG: hypothetical protein MUP17_04195 [candidate division Zixibacteria bacterium]|nr:hypothetical protein [candidate division Zixibacteria bacterium]
MSKSAIYLFMLLLIPFSLTFSQTISSQFYENEEDIEEGLLSGDLTYAEYLELLDLLHEGVAFSSPQKDRLLFLPDFTQSEVEQLADSSSLIPLPEKTAPFYSTAGSFFLPEILSQAKGRISLQSRQRFDQDYSSDFVLTKFQVEKRFLFQFELQREGTSDPQVKKRSLEILNLGYVKRIVLGSFDKKIGLGLNIGYHPLLKADDENKQSSFLYPISGRFNGVLIQSDFGFFQPELILSKNKKGTPSQELWALNLSASFKDFNFGLLRSEGRLKKVSSFYDRNLSFYLKGTKGKLGLSSEYSILNNGATGWASVLIFRDKPVLVELSGWSYSNNYVHLFGAGPSNPDYTLTTIDEIEYEYPSREKGEKGVMLKSVYRLSSRYSLNFSYSQWDASPYSSLKLRQKIGLKITLSEKLKTGLDYLYSNSDLENETASQHLLSSTFLFGPLKDIFFRLITRYGKKRAATSSDWRNSFEFQLRSDFQKSSPFLLTLWARYKDNDLSKGEDSYWDFRFQERLSLLKNSIFYGEYFIKLPSGAQAKTQGAKFRLEVGF